MRQWAAKPLSGSSRSGHTHASAVKQDSKTAAGLEPPDGLIIQLAGRTGLEARTHHNRLLRVHLLRGPPLTECWKFVSNTEASGSGSGEVYRERFEIGERAVREGAFVCARKTTRGA